MTCWFVWNMNNVEVTSNFTDTMRWVMGERCVLHLKPRADCSTQVRNPLRERVRNESHTGFWFQVPSIPLPHHKQTHQNKQNWCSIYWILVLFLKALLLCRKMWSLQGRSVEAGKGLEVQKQKWGQIGSQRHSVSLASKQCKIPTRSTKNKATA